MFETRICFSRCSRRPFTVAMVAVTCLLALPATALGTPLISELFYDAVGSDNGQSFVELSGTPGTLLDGMTLEGVNGAGGAIGPVITLSGVIAADGLFVVADTSTEGMTDVPMPDQLANFDFQNGPDSVVLRDGGGAAIDAIGYGSFSAGDVFAGEGMPALDAPAGSSLARLLADVDTDDNAADFQLLALPTPGEADFAAVPEPSTAVMMGVGLLSLSVLGRRRRGVQLSPR